MDFASKLRENPSVPLTPERLQRFTNKLARYALEKIDEILSSPEGRKAYAKLPPDLKREFERRYKAAVEDPLKNIGKLLEFVNAQAAEASDTSNFFWLVKSALQTDPVKGIVDLRRVNMA